MKKCRTCGKKLPLSEYYKHSEMLDGHLNICKECTKNRITKHRENNIDRIREYDRKRGLLEHRKSANRKRSVNYNKLETTRARHRKCIARNKDKMAMSAISYRKKYPEKYIAKIKTGNAMRNGKLIKQPCVKCGSTENINAHHEDYSKPLEIIWLCRFHHGERHREINEQKRNKLKKVK
ncbi:MAG: hypothetical protein DRQ46_00065 [Gammaproteobacteria bacterium]|nr:MAG: hypothetical protein DRQ46_00065 [Gammaproteobacteria bacterium]